MEEKDKTEGTREEMEEEEEEQAGAGAGAGAEGGAGGQIAFGRGVERCVLQREDMLRSGGLREDGMRGEQRLSLSLSLSSSFSLLSAQALSTSTPLSLCVCSVHRSLSLFPSG